MNNPKRYSDEWFEKMHKDQEEAETIRCPVCKEAYEPGEDYHEFVSYYGEAGAEDAECTHCGAEFFVKETVVRTYECGMVTSVWGDVIQDDDALAYVTKYIPANLLTIRKLPITNMHPSLEVGRTYTNRTGKHTFEMIFLTDTFVTISIDGENREYECYIISLLAQIADGRLILMK